MAYQPSWAIWFQTHRYRRTWVILLTNRWRNKAFILFPAWLKFELASCFPQVSLFTRELPYIYIFTEMNVGWKVSWNDILSAVDQFFYQSDPSTATSSKRRSCWTINLIWSHMWVFYVFSSFGWGYLWTFMSTIAYIYIYVNMYVCPYECMRVCVCVCVDPKVFLNREWGFFKLTL